MRYEATVHRLFDSGDERFVYAASSASILALDAESEAVLKRFTGAGADLDEWLREPGAQGSLETFEELVRAGLLKPSGEVPPAPPELPPMPYPLATLVLNVTNKCNLACTYCYEFGEDRLTDAADTAKRAPRMSAETAMRIGLVSEVVPGEELREAAGWLASTIASQPATAVQASLRAIWAANDMGRHDALAMAPAILTTGMSKQALAEGQEAFTSGARVTPRTR